MWQNIKKWQKGLAVLLFLSLVSLAFVYLTSAKIERIKYSAFVSLVEQGQVESILIDVDALKVMLTDGTRVATDNPGDPALRRMMLEQGINVRQSFLVEWGEVIGIWVVMIGFSGGLYFVVTKRFNPSKNAARSLPAFNTEMRTATFSHVAGAAEVKQELWDVVEFLRNPSKFTAMGIRAPRGVMLYGPPGTGKTLLARAVAGEAGVPFMFVSGSDFVEMYVGVGASRVRQLFQSARKKAPCVIFIDEIDGVARSRGSGSHSNEERDQTLNALLAEMDGFTPNDGIVVIATTNRLDVIDAAILRPGRFDKHVLVGYPNVNERAAILERHAQTKPVGPEVDLFRIARRAIGFSGADLENLLNESAIAALRRGVAEIAWQDLDEGYNRVLVGPKKVDNPMTEDEKRMVAYHEAGHALITRLVANLPIDKVTIAPTNRALGYVLPVQLDSRIKTKRDLFNNVCIALGGMAAEKMMFGDEAITTGNQQDIREATSIAYKMVSSLGMSKLGAVALNGGAEMADCLSDDIKNEAFAEMQAILKEAEEKSRTYLIEHQYLLERLAAELVEVETMDGEQLDALLGESHTAHCT